jgi:GNAT superfamily N-acetyltransferase
VRPAYRRQGLGRALLERVADIGARRGCGRFEWSALHWNENALQFYQKLGARQLDEWVTLRMEAAAIKNLARVKEPGAA